MGGGTGFAAGAIALPGERRPSGLDRNTPEQNKIYKADGLDLREAWHKHLANRVLWGLERCGKPQRKQICKVSMRVALIQL